MLSAAYGQRTLLTSFGVSLFILAYNEGGGAGSHWLVRNALNAIGYALAEAGATLVACTSLSQIDRVPLIPRRSNHARQQAEVKAKPIA